MDGAVEALTRTAEQEANNTPRIIMTFLIANTTFIIVLQMGPNLYCTTLRPSRTNILITIYNNII